MKIYGSETAKIRNIESMRRWRDKRHRWLHDWYKGERQTSVLPLIIVFCALAVAYITARAMIAML